MRIIMGSIPDYSKLFHHKCRYFIAWVVFDTNEYRICIYSLLMFEILKQHPKTTNNTSQSIILP